MRYTKERREKKKDNYIDKMCISIYNNMLLFYIIFVLYNLMFYLNFISNKTK